MLCERWGFLTMSILVLFLSGVTTLPAGSLQLGWLDTRQSQCYKGDWLPLFWGVIWRHQERWNSHHLDCNAKIIFLLLWSLVLKPQWVAVCFELEIRSPLIFSSTSDTAFRYKTLMHASDTILWHDTPTQPSDTTPTALARWPYWVVVCSHNFVSGRLF